MYLLQNSFPPIFICPQNHLIHILTDIYLHYIIIFWCYPIQNSHMLTTNLFNISTKQVQKIDQAHCSNQIRIMADPNSQSFQHLLHNKPAKVDHNLISFRQFSHSTKKSYQQNFFNDSLTFNSYDVCSRLFNAKFIQRLQQRHKIEQLTVQKTSRRKHSEKEHFDAF